MDDLDLGATIKGFNPGQKIFGRYTLKRILGRGGMGVVWLARDGELDRDVALKFLPEIVALDPEALSDLKGETRRNLELTHPHIVRIYDFISDRTAAAISMEYVDGSTLAALKLDQPGRVFPVSELGPWIRQLCTALTYAHTEAQVVHRDLKPANLMIDARGDLKIADFGIAASVSDSVSRVSAQAGGSSGTPLYMSPQQMLGEKPCVADDIYSLGATLYELLTGKPPFYSGNVLLQVQSKRPPPIAERRQELAIAGEPVPREWEATIAACLSKEAKDRPASTEEVAERLGLAASAAGRKEQGAGSKVEKTTGAATVPGVERLAPKTLIGSADQASGPKRSGSKSVLYVGLAAAVVLLAGVGYYFGIYAPEQARLEAEAVKLRTEQERVMAEAKAKAEQERLLAEHLAAARGGLVIRTTPSGAEVRVGAIAIDKSPLTLKDQKLGKYPVKVRADGYEDWAGEVEVRENEFTDLDVKLVRSTGSLHVTSVPAGIDVLVDGTKSRTPLDLKGVPTGAHELVFVRPGWPDVRQNITVNRNDLTEIRQELVGGSLAIASTPANAEVWLRGSRVGVTPLNLQDQPPGPAEIELRHKGYGTAKRTVEFVPGREAEKWEAALKAGGTFKGRPDFRGGPSKMRVKFSGTTSGSSKSQITVVSDYDYSDPSDEGVWNRITDRVIANSNSFGAGYNYVDGTTIQYQRASSGHWNGRLISGGWANGEYKPLDYDKYLLPYSALVWTSPEEMWPTNEVAAGGSWKVPVSIRIVPFLGQAADAQGTMTGRLTKLTEESAEISYDFDLTARNTNVNLVFRWSGSMQIRVNLTEKYVTWASIHFHQDGDSMHFESTMVSEVLSVTPPSQ